MTYDHRNTGTREDLLRARSEGRSLMARRRVTIVYRFSPREDLYARTQRYVARISAPHRPSSPFPSQGRPSTPVHHINKRTENLFRIARGPLITPAP